MPEALKEVIRFLFENANLDVIFCGHFLWNEQSHRVQEKVVSNTMHLIPMRQHSVQRKK
ncbi:MAG: GNAT family N-acetyltransferase [Ruminococcus callidus]